MSLENTWKQLDKQSDTDLSAMLQLKKVPTFVSKNPLVKIKKQLFISMALGVLACLLYIGVIYYFKFWQLRLLPALMLVYSLWLLYITYDVHKKMNKAGASVDTLQISLKIYYQIILKWTKIQQRSLLFIAPISSTAGFAIGDYIATGKLVPTIIDKSETRTLVIAIIVLEVAVYFLAKWLFKRYNAKYLKLLQENTNELMSEK